MLSAGRRADTPPLRCAAEVPRLGEECHAHRPGDLVEVRSARLEACSCRTSAEARQSCPRALSAGVGRTTGVLLGSVPAASTGKLRLWSRGEYPWRHDAVRVAVPRVEVELEIVEREGATSRSKFSRSSSPGSTRSW